jgi:hypothetical protein
MKWESIPFVLVDNLIRDCGRERPIPQSIDDWLRTISDQLTSIEDIIKEINTLLRR